MSVLVVKLCHARDRAEGNTVPAAAFVASVLLSAIVKLVTWVRQIRYGQERGAL
jgi:hypothetical protein